MKQAVQGKDRRLYLLSGELYSAARIGAWCYDKNQHLFYSTDPHAKELESFLKLSGILERALQDNSSDPIPYVRDDELGIQWITEKVNIAEGGEIFIVIGPMFLKAMSREFLMKKLSNMRLSLATQFRSRKILADIPVVDQAFLGAVCRMLHFTIYDEYLGPTEIHFEDAVSRHSSESKDPEKISEVKKGPEQSGPKRGLFNNYERMAEIEKELLDCIRAGVYEERKPGSPINKSYNGELQNYGIEDELRTAKDNVIIFIDKCMNAAVESGLSIQDAREIENKAIQKIENSRTFGEVANANWNTFLQYVHEVHTVKESLQLGISPAVQSTRNYIRSHYREAITLADLAKNVNYSEYYLSRKFTRETGYKIQDYVKEVRIDMAKVELVTSEKSINEIAEGLQFKSRSHFDRIFNTYTGMTPAKYRNRNGLHNSSTD